MARKNLLSGLVDAENTEQAILYPVRGASKSMIRSVNELARQADAYLEGENIVDLDPGSIDGSFVLDRMGDNREQYEELLQAIREHGQNSPILVRPHPLVDGRYMVVFGHRRVRVARELGRKVRSVVKAVDDKAHVIAQGQENSARSNLTFIEKSTFAKRLEALGYDRETISSALGANAAAVSKMVSVASRIPEAIIRRIGSAPGIGRERWVELSLLIPKKLDVVEEYLARGTLDDMESDDRFERILATLNAKGKPVRKASAKVRDEPWAPKTSRLASPSKRPERRLL